MSNAEKSSPDVQAVLAGAPGIVTGLTFVPHEALAGVRWGTGGMPSLAVAACSRLSPDFAFVPSWEIWSAEALDRISACGVQVFWVVPGPLGLVAQRNGWPDTLKRTLSQPAVLRDELDAEMLAVLEAVRRGSALGARAIVVAEDLAGADTLLVAPDYVFEELMPFLGRVVETAAEASTPTLLHSDGDTRAILHAVRKAGFVGLHVGGLAPDRFSRLLDAARSEGLCVVGGLPSAELDRGPIVASGAGMRAALLARQGGLLIADDGGITTPEQLGALMTAFAAARETGI